MSTDIRTRRARCRQDCATTRGGYGGRGGPGHVRRCEHGRLWEWCGDRGMTDYWAPVWPIQFLTRWRAARALRT